MSLLNKKPPVDDSRTAQLMTAARQAMNTTTGAAQQTVPLARNAGTSVKQGTDSAIAWVTPYADAARHWVAPRLEHSAHAINESIAPKISDALLSAANKIEVQPKPRHRLVKFAIVSVAMLLTAGAAALLAMRRQQLGEESFGMAEPAPGTDESMPGDGSQGQGGFPDAEGDGQRIV